MRRIAVSALALTLLATSIAVQPAGRAAAGPLPTVSQQATPQPLVPPAAAGGASPVQPASTAPTIPVSQPAASGASFNVTVAGQSGSSTTARVHDVVTFDAGPLQAGTTAYSWDFGDSSQVASGPKASHAYGLVNDYTVTLTTADATGKTASTTQQMRVIPIIDSLVSVPTTKQIMVGAVIPASLYVQAPGPATVNASLTGDLISGSPTVFSTGDALAFATLSGQVANENNATIDQDIIQKPGGSVPLQGNVGLDLSYQTAAGTNVDLNFLLSLQKDRDAGKGIWSITYPNFSLITGTTDPSEPDIDSYYMKGDPGFHHPDDPLVRKYAMQAARAGGALSDDPAKVMENIYTFDGGLFGSDDPAQVEPDTIVTQKIANGELVPGQQSEKYICISQTYFTTSMARTLGLPSRELTIALANPVSQASSGAWTVDYVQEGAAEVWFDNSWHLYDTWLRIRNLDDYLIRKYAYQAWYAYSAQNYNLVAKNGDQLNLYGHNFAIGEQEGTPGDPGQWYLRQRSERTGVVVDGFPTS